jgi:ABC-type glycerol-3-phosphate transport system permease component
MNAAVEGIDLSAEELESLEVHQVRTRPGEWFGKALTYVALTLYSLYSILPIYWMFTLAFKPETEIYTNKPKLWGFVTTLDNWREVFAGQESSTGVDFIQAMTNSVLVVAPAVILALILGMPVAYVLARYNFKNKGDVHFFYLSLYFMPPMLILIPCSCYTTGWVSIIPTSVWCWSCN